MTMKKGNLLNITRILQFILINQREGQAIPYGRKPTDKCRRNNKFRETLLDKNQWMMKRVPSSLMRMTGYSHVSSSLPPRYIYKGQESNFPVKKPDQHLF